MRRDGFYRGRGLMGTMAGTMPCAGLGGSLAHRRIDREIRERKPADAEIEKQLQPPARRPLGGAAGLLDTAAEESSSA